MNLGEAFRSAKDGISTHKLRSGLTMLGIMFGVGAVISMLSIGAGAARQAQAIIDRMGLRNVLVRAKQLRPDELAAVRKKSLGVSLRDANAIAEAVPGVVAVAPRLRIEPWKVQAGAPNDDQRATGASAMVSKTQATVFGVSHRLPQLIDLPLVEGRFLDALDEKDHAQVCVVGRPVRRDLFAYGPALGQRIKVNDIWCEVIGVVADAGDDTPHAAAESSNREIYMPVTTASRKFEHEPLAAPLDEILVGLSPRVSSRESAAVIRALVDNIHGGVDDYEIVVPEALLEQSRQTQDLFNLVMGCIAGISLLVGGIGIMNIMLASVLERTREIGVRRAIGADQWDICLQFLVESFSISAIGGLMGVAIGVGIAHSVSTYARWPTVVTVTSIALAITVSLFVGILSGLYPAVRAAQVAPIQALRYE